MLKTKRVAISLLPITSKVIDTVFGKLPGTLAEFFANALASWLQDERRVVIYQFPDLLRITMETRMNELMRAKFPSSLGSQVTASALQLKQKISADLRYKRDAK